MPTSYKKADLFHLPSTTPRVEKFINMIMVSGKKNIAREIFTTTLKEIGANGHTNPMLVWETAIENASPNLMVKSKRVGGAVYAIPLEVKGEKKFFYAVKWIVEAARKAKGKPMHKKLAKELLESYTNQ